MTKESLPDPIRDDQLDPDHDDQLDPVRDDLLENLGDLECLVATLLEIVPKLKDPNLERLLRRSLQFHALQVELTRDRIQGHNPRGGPETYGSERKLESWVETTDLIHSMPWQTLAWVYRIVDPNLTLEEYARRLGVPKRDFSEYVGNNQLCWDEVAFQEPIRGFTACRDQDDGSSGGTLEAIEPEEPDEDEED